jgi:hypothetical protein
MEFVLLFDITYNNSFMECQTLYFGEQKAAFWGRVAAGLVPVYYTTWQQFPGASSVIMKLFMHFRQRTCSRHHPSY